MPASDITYNGGNGVESPRPQADPLPLKPGEIGYIEVAEPPAAILHNIDMRDLPTRHPLDTDYPSVSSNAATPLSQSDVVTSPSSEQSSSPTSMTKSHGILDLFKPEGPPAFWGLRLYTLVIFVVQLILLGGTVIIWVFTTKCLAQTLFGQSAIIFFHIVFIIVILVQLVFLERRLFRLRGERYSYVHPGEMLPRYRSMPRSSMTLNFAPWNRPPLPTYAAALSQSGFGTGDVEDHVIACPPPPPYGSTRDSTLLLRGFLRNSLRANSGRAGSPSSDVSRDVSRDEQGDRVQGELEETIESPSVAHIVVR